MRFHYYPETDSLYIDLTKRASVHSRELASGIILDFDETGTLVGIDLDHARQKAIAVGLLLGACVVAALSIARWMFGDSQARGMATAPTSRSSLPTVQ